MGQYNERLPAERLFKIYLSFIPKAVKTYLYLKLIYTSITLEIKIKCVLLTGSMHSCVAISSLMAYTFGTIY